MSGNRATAAPAQRRVSPFARLASRRLLIVSGGVFLVVAPLLFWSRLPFAIPVVTESCGQEPPDVSFTSDADAIMGFLVACGPAGREAYAAMQRVDLLYPAILAPSLPPRLRLYSSALFPTDRGSSPSRGYPCWPPERTIWRTSSRG